MAKELVKKEETALACIAEMEADAGGGFEGVDTESKDKPYLIICQKATPVADASNQAHIEGIMPGMIFNTATEEFYDGKKGISVIPCAFARKFIEKEHGEDGKFIAIHDTHSDVVRSASFVEMNGRNILTTAHGTKLEDTRYHFVLYSTDDVNYEPAVIRMKSSQVRKSTLWNGRMDRMKVDIGGRVIKPATWWQKYKLSVTIDPPKNGKTWFGWVIEQDGTVQNADVAAMGKAFHDAVVSGNVPLKDTASVVETEVVEDEIAF